MADITMCLNKECEKRESCYRYTATPNEYWQSYGAFAPVNGECIYYVEVRDG